MIIKLEKPTKKEYDSISNRLGSKVKKLILKEVESARNHFDTDGWDLNVNSIKEEVIHNLLGIDIDELLMSEMLNRIENINCKLQETGFVFSKKSIAPVSFDGNKIVLNDEEDKHSSIVFLGEL